MAGKVLFNQVFAVVIVVVFSAIAANAQTETESFDSPPADWVGFENHNATIGTDFGYSSTNNAGGAVGEAGGVFPRTQIVAYYADTTIGSLSRMSTLAATGKFSLENIDADGRIDLGWFDANDPPAKMDFIGFSINNGVFLQAAARATGGGELAVSNEVGLPNGQYNFAIAYNGAGGLQVTFTDPDGIDPPRVANLNIPAGTYSLNAFGITTSGEVGSNIPDLTANVYIDDLTYTVGVIPEPSTVLLAAICGLLLPARLRMRK